MEIPQDFVFFSYDGDGIGRKVGRAILADDTDELRHISHLIEAGHALVQRWVKDRAGVWINGGGDEGNAAVKKEYISDLEQLRKDYEYLVGATMSVGVGKKPSQAGRALLIAKLKGKNQTVVFNKEIEKEIKAIKKRAKKGAMKSMEEYKLAEAYLNKAEEESKEVDCPYCQQTDGIDPDHCKWCHDLEAQEGQEACPFCQDNAAQATKEPEIASEDCSFCQEEESAVPESEQGLEEMEMNPAEIPKPDQNDMGNIGQNAPMDAPSDEDPNQKLSDSREVAPAASAPIDPEDNHSKEALMSIAEQIREEGTPLASQVDSIGEEDIGSGTEMEGNVSRPEGFNQNTPSDMGEEGPNGVSESLSDDDEPDYGSILEDGLDQNANEIQKEKAVQMVSQALVQFKGCKDVLEQNKMQMPQLYQASLSMLRAMIEMAGVLKLGGNSMPMQGESMLGQEQTALAPAQEENEWHEPFPAHPDHGGEAKPGHAPSAQPAAAPMGMQKEGAIGQPIGKLPSKNTTEHVARTPMPVGAVNAKGQQKVQDDQGNIRFIDMKQGMVKGASGVPVKPEKK